MENLEILLKQQATRICQAGGIDKPLVINRRSIMCISVRTSHKSLLPNGVVLGVSSSGATYFMEPKEAIELNNEEVRLSDYEKIEIISGLTAELMISQLGLSDFFKAVEQGSECEHPKPASDAYLKALEILQVSKDHTIIFEDSVSGIKAGVEAGVPVIGLTTRNPPRLLNQEKPTFLILDYEDQKLWTALEELDTKSGKVTDTA